jgi:hypothetical protein
VTRNILAIMDREEIIEFFKGRLTIGLSDTPDGYGSGSRIDLTVKLMLDGEVISSDWVRLQLDNEGNYG